jgi:hypothetical protein
MTKKKNTPPAAPADLDLSKLTPEEKDKMLMDLQSENTQLKASVKTAKAAELPSFEVDEDEENDVEGGTYQFTAPRLTWDDNQEYDVRALAASKEKKDMELYDTICAELVLRKSGLVALKGKEE